MPLTTGRLRWLARIACAVLLPTGSPHTASRGTSGSSPDAAALAARTVLPARLLVQRRMFDLVSESAPQLRDDHRVGESHGEQGQKQQPDVVKQHVRLFPSRAGPLFPALHLAGAAADRQQSLHVPER